MKKFKFSFKGRLNTSIGICYKNTLVINAETQQDALNELYSQYEHISGLTMNGKILSY